MKLFLSSLKSTWVVGAVLLIAGISSQVNWALNAHFYQDLPFRLLAATAGSLLVWPVYVAGLRKLLSHWGIPEGRQAPLLNQVHLPFLGLVFMLLIKEDWMLLFVILAAALTIFLFLAREEVGEYFQPREISPSRIFGLLIMAFALLLLLKSAWLSDDAYITFRTIDNFWQGHGLRWNVAERVQTYTHPLWMLLMGLAYGITREWFLTAIVLSVGLSFASLYLLKNRFAASYGTGIFVVAALLSAKSFVDYTSSGLENPLSFLLLLLFAGIFLKKEIDLAAFRWLCLLAALAALNRMDALLFFLVPLGYAALQLWKTEKAGINAVLFAGLIGFSPFILWEWFSLVYYGFLFPNTYYAKVHTGIAGHLYMIQGLTYLWDSVTRDPVTPLMIGSGLIVAWRSRQLPLICLAAGILMYLVYILSVGGDFMAGRFLSLPLWLSIIIWGTCRLDVRQTIGLSLLVVGIGLLAKHPTLGYGRWKPGVEEKEIADTGIADERLFYLDKGTLSRINIRFTHPGFEEFGTEKPAEKTLLRGTVGRDAFWLGPEYDIVDIWALTDPLLARLPTRNVHYWRIGHFERALPPGYFESRLSGENQIEAAGLHELYDKLNVLTREPIWSLHRFREIWKFNTGQYNHLMQYR